MRGKLVTIRFLGIVRTESIHRYRIITFGVCKALFAKQSDQVMRDIKTRLKKVCIGSNWRHTLVRAVNGEQVKNWQEMTQQIHPRAGQTVRLTVERDGKRFEVVLTPRAITQQSVGDRTVTVGAIGVAPADGFVTNRLKPLTALVEASKRTGETIVMIIMGMGKVIVGVFSLQTTGGQILMAQMTAPQVQQGFVNMILFTALLSINLGVLNLLPFPFLDGGRLCFLVIEVLQGRPVSLKVLRMAQWGAVALFDNFCLQGA